jgi:hypothetical protein
MPVCLAQLFRSWAAQDSVDHINHTEKSDGCRYRSRSNPAASRKRGIDQQYGHLQSLLF